MLTTTTRKPTHLVRLLLAVALVASSALLTSSAATAAYAYKAPTKLSSTIVGSTQLEIEWLHVSGAPAYVIRAATTGETTKVFRSGNNTVKMTGLTRNTTYSIKVAVAASTESGAARLSAYSSILKLKTANYALNAPSELTVTAATTSTATLSWTAPANVTSSDLYSVTYALDSGLTKSPKTKKTTDNTASITLTGMVSDTNFYVRVKVVDKDSGSTRSDTSDYGLIKTRAEYGNLTGTVNGTGDVVVVAYDKSNDVVGQADVAGNGNYSIQVSPGTYWVLATYTGTNGYTSLWAKSGANGVALRTDGTSRAVALGENQGVPDITLTKGGEASGTVTDTSGDPIATVDVTALLSGVVMARATTATNGSYTIQGLPVSNDYKLRFKYRGTSGTGVGFKPGTSATFNVTGTGTTSVATEKLALDSWAKEIRSKIKGTKRVGKTLKRYNNHWVASNYPKERASSWSYQWLRNGSAISGATAYKYKLKSADRGKKISLKITYRHYGFPTGSTTSKAYRIS